jgi:hypothetical protein
MLNKEMQRKAFYGSVAEFYETPSEKMAREKSEEPAGCKLTRA